MRTASISEREVAWYRKNGKYPQSRIVRTHKGRGEEYVIGDWSWNRLNPLRREEVERRMNAEISPQP